MAIGHSGAKVRGDEPANKGGQVEPLRQRGDRVNMSTQASRRSWATHTWEGVRFERVGSVSGNQWWEIPDVLPGRRFWFLVDAENAAIAQAKG